MFAELLKLIPVEYRSPDEKQESTQPQILQLAIDTLTDLLSEKEDLNAAKILISLGGTQNKGDEPKC